MDFPQILNSYSQNVNILPCYVTILFPLLVHMCVYFTYTESNITDIIPFISQCFSVYFLKI
jgi:hypothetical protein